MRIGILEEYVLRSIVALGGSVSGIPIRIHLEKHLGKFSNGAIYTTLTRLKEKGLVISELGEKTAKRGGKAKILYSLSQTGLAELNDLNALRKQIAGIS